MADKPRLKLVTNVSEFGLFLSLARSRTRLIIATLLLNGALFGATWWVSGYIIEASTSVFLNLVLIAATMLLLLACSYIEAMLVGDLFFPGRWRERVLLNKKIEIDPDSPEALQAGFFKSYNIVFLLVLAGLIIGNYVATNATAGDYLDDYHDLGFSLTQLRNDDIEEKERAWVELTKPIYRHLWTDPRLIAAVEDELADEQPEVERWAVWGAGQMEMKSVFEPLMARMTDAEAPPATRAAAATALGKLRDPRAYGRLQTFLKEARGDRTLAIGGLRGAALTGSPEFGPAVRPFLDAEDPEVRAHAYWALQKIGDEDATERLMATLEEGSAVDKCLALEALKGAATTEEVRALKNTFLVLDADSDPTCEEVVWVQPNGEKIRVAWKETHRVKILKIVWNAAHGDEADWYQQVAIDKQMAWPVRAQASDLIDFAKHEAGTL